MHSVKLQNNCVLPERRRGTQFKSTIPEESKKLYNISFSTNSFVAIIQITDITKQEGRFFTATKRHN